MIDLTHDLGTMTRAEAIALFWERCAAIAKQIHELQSLRSQINVRWGRAPRLPNW